MLPAVLEIDQCRRVLGPVRTVIEAEIQAGGDGAAVEIVDAVEIGRREAPLLQRLLPFAILQRQNLSANLFRNVLIIFQ